MKAKQAIISSPKSSIFFVDEKYLADDGNPDMEKMELIVFDPIHHGYIQLSSKIGNAFSDGKALK